MNDTERKQIEDLLVRLKEAEEKNRYYEQLLTKNNISFQRMHTAVPSEQTASANLIVPITREHVKLFLSVFQGRAEFYAKRTKYQTYTRPCWNRYDNSGICPKQSRPDYPCRECTNQAFKRLTEDTVYKHLTGENEDCSDVIGIYPITKNNTCWFIVFDFDDHNHKSIFTNSSHKDELTGSDQTFWKDVRILVQICDRFSVPFLVERSRSGYGAHVWIFFDRELPCKDARRFGNLLLSKGMESVQSDSFRTYDRMLPMQDYLEDNQAGNLIALPLQGRALADQNSAFVDRNFRVFPDQWRVLKELRRLSTDTVYEYLSRWNQENPYGDSIITDEEDPTKPWDKDTASLLPQDVKGPVQIVLANGVYICKDNMNIRMQNRLRRLALYRNPEYFKTRKRNPEINSMKIPYFIYCGKDIRNYICLPRGCSDSLYNSLTKAGITYHIEDKTEHSETIDVTFNGVLKENQVKAVSSLQDQDTGIISAATAFGKTVVGAALIAERKQRTLILVNRSEIMDGWFDTLNEFLSIHADLPEYSTPKGRIKTRKTIIGRYGSGKHELNGIIDIAMIQSLVNEGIVKEDIVQTIKNYGLVIVDECHHVSGGEYQILLSTVLAKYVYGFTATPKRYDSQDQKMYFQLGKIRYRFSAKERAAEQNIDHLVWPRFTSTVNSGIDSNDYTRLTDMLTRDQIRNDLICKDVLKCIEQKRTPIILTKRIEHAGILYDLLKDKADHVFNMAGKTKTSERKVLLEERKNVSPDESVILISTASKAGEGFNYPRLDTLMLVAPVSWEGSIEQYAGRLNRDHPGKKNVIIFDYIDAGIPMFERMYRKRLHTYSQIGFEICSAIHEENMEKSSIYTGITYMPELLRDICSCGKDTVIVSPYLSSDVLDIFLSRIRDIIPHGITIHIMTLDPDVMDEEFRAGQKKKIIRLRSSGIYVSCLKTRKVDSSFAVIGGEIVWYGNVNLLVRNDEDSEVIRICDSHAARELQNKAMDLIGRKRPSHVLQIKMDI